MKTNFDTQNNKRAYIDKLIDSSDKVNPKYNVHLFSKERGVYSGVVRLVEKAHDRFKYYGFIINFPDSYISLEGISGKKIMNNDNNLGKVFSDSYALEQQGLGMLTKLGSLLASEGYERSNNLGRGIYRAIMEYPTSEQVYTNFKENTNYDLIRSVDSLAYYDNKAYQDKHNGSDEGYTFNLRRAWGLSKGNFKLLKSMKYTGSAVTGEEETYSINKRLSLLRMARKYAHDVDKERGYHDAEEWFRGLFIEFMSYPYKYLDASDAREHQVFFSTYSVPRIYTASLLAPNDKQSWMHTVKYFYGSLYHQQAFGSIEYAGRTYMDYAGMVRDFDNWVRFPRYLETAHAIAIRNSETLKRFDETNGVIKKYRKFKGIEGMYDKYSFILAYDAEEIVNEGQQQSNCVAGYVSSVARGNSLIAFLRKNPNQSWVTIELRINEDDSLTMCQVYEPFNSSLGKESKTMLHAWAKAKGINIAYSIGGCPDTTNWDNEFTKRISKFKPLEESKHTVKAQEALEAFSAKEKDSEKQKAEYKQRMLADNENIKKAS